MRKLSNILANLEAIKKLCRIIELLNGSVIKSNAMCTKMDTLQNTVENLTLSAGNITVDPNGLALEAKQDTLITAVGDLDAQLVAQVALLLAGRATEAKQDDIITALGALVPTEAPDHFVFEGAGVSGTVPAGYLYLEIHSTGIAPALVNSQALDPGTSLGPIVRPHPGVTLPAVDFDATAPDAALRVDYFT